MYFVVDKKGFIYSSGRDLTYFSRNVHHMAIREEDLLSGSSMERLLQIYNANCEIPIRDFKDIDDARTRVAQLLTHFKLEDIPMAKRNQTPAADTNVVDAAQTATPAADAAAPKGNASRTPKSAIIRVKATANPKRPGSAAHTRFALYKDGMTVGDFVEAGGTMGDINFDQGKGFIELEGIDAPAAAEAAPAAEGETPAADASAEG